MNLLSDDCLFQFRLNQEENELISRVNLECDIRMNDIVLNIHSSIFKDLMKMITSFAKIFVEKAIEVVRKPIPKVMNKHPMISDFHST